MMIFIISNLVYKPLLPKNILFVLLLVFNLNLSVFVYTVYHVFCNICVVHHIYSVLSI